MLVARTPTTETAPNNDANVENNVGTGWLGWLGWYGDIGFKGFGGFGEILRRRMMRIVRKRMGILRNVQTAAHRSIAKPTVSGFRC